MSTEVVKFYQTCYFSVRSPSVETSQQVRMSKRSNRAQKTAKSSPPSFISPSVNQKIEQKKSLDARNSESAPVEISIPSTQSDFTVKIIADESLTNHESSENHTSNTNGNNSIGSLTPGHDSLDSETTIANMPASAVELVEGAASPAESRSPPPADVLTNGHHHEAVDEERDAPAPTRVTSAKDYEVVQPSKSPLSPVSSPSPSCSPSPSLAQQYAQRCLSPAASPARRASPSPRHRTRTTSSTSSTSGEVSVPMFFTGKGILVTGATGFIGKVLIEKLLRCCPDLACVYCLIRPKNKQAIETRLEDITSSKVSQVTFDITGS